MVHSNGRILDWGFDPVEALLRWPRQQAALLLHSGRLDPRWARWSILACPVGTYRFQAAADPSLTHPPPGCSEWLSPTTPCPAPLFTHKPFHDLRSLLQATQNHGLWIGYLSYDLGRWVERLPSHATSDRDWPIIELAYCPGYLVYDGLNGKWAACGAWRDSPGFPDLSRAQPHQYSLAVTGAQPGISRRDYESGVDRVKQYIAAGDVFQVNLAQRFTTQTQRGDITASRGLYADLAAVSPAWYGAYLELASSGCAVASISPELFLRVAGRHVTTRPIKGTRPGHVNPSDLRRSEKDIAELNMIVDLMRNDLGRVCSYGSIRVTQPRAIESHPTVHHGVATIEGRLHPFRDVIDLLRATLPGGSVTGAPKVRAMQIIDQLEPARRGPYCGCVGYLSLDQACLNIAIRTALVDSGAGRVDFSVGSGIVADSDPGQEYQETLDKAAAILAALERHTPVTITRPTPQTVTNQTR